ncbi:MAG: hypothetical protein CMP33_03440 [Rickettsiales bacterium]|nr:hypothetical protein [Rickettsiales bacterium]|tara:strand:- start:34571 stop:35143 length:573 start_codon:yes stop_codon:yes gene_type:complete
MELFDFKPVEIKPTYVIFDPESGEIKRLTGDKQNKNCLEITNDKYKELTANSITKYRIEFNPATTVYEIVDKNKNDNSELLVDNLLHLVEETKEETDIILVKDYKEEKWKLKFGKTFGLQLKEKNVQLKIIKHFSITQENDPHVLYRSLEFNLDGGKYQVNFDSLDKANKFYSIYTYKRFNSYGHQIVQN